MKLRFLLVAVLILATAFGLHFFSQGDTNTSTTLEPADGLRSQDIEPSGGELPAAEATAASTEGQPKDANEGEVGAAPNIESDAPTTDELSDGRELRWQERYGDLDVPGLRSELTDLEHRFDNLRDLALDDQFTLGRYRSTSPGDPPSSTETAPDGSPLISETRTATNAETLEIEARTVTLAMNEHGALYELQAEINWLKALIGE
jgi:hypothetical protein